MHSYFFSNKHCARILHGCLSDFLERNAFYICESFSDMSNIHRKIALSAMRYWRKIRSVSFKSKTIKRGHFYRFDQWIVIFAECDNAGKGQKKSKLEKLFSHLRRSDVAVNNPAQFSLILLEDCIKIFVGIPTVYHKRFLCFKRNIDMLSKDYFLKLVRIFFESKIIKPCFSNRNNFRFLRKFSKRLFVKIIFFNMRGM